MLSTRPFGVAAPEGHFLFYDPGVAAPERLLIAGWTQEVKDQSYRRRAEQKCDADDNDDRMQERMAVCFLKFLADLAEQQGRHI